MAHNKRSLHLIPPHRHLSPSAMPPRPWATLHRTPAASAPHLSSVAVTPFAFARWMWWSREVFQNPAGRIGGAGLRSGCGSRARAGSSRDQTSPKRTSSLSSANFGANLLIASLPAVTLSILIHSFRTNLFQFRIFCFIHRFQPLRFRPWNGNRHMGQTNFPEQLRANALLPAEC